MRYVSKSLIAVLLRHVIADKNRISKVDICVATDLEFYLLYNIILLNHSEYTTYN